MLMKLIKLSWQKGLKMIKSSTTPFKVALKCTVVFTTIFLLSHFFVKLLVTEDSELIDLLTNFYHDDIGGRLNLIALGIIFLSLICLFLATLMKSFLPPEDFIGNVIPYWLFWGLVVGIGTALLDTIAIPRFFQNIFQFVFVGFTYWLCLRWLRSSRHRVP
jgi:hypothetical protein